MPVLVAATLGALGNLSGVPGDWICRLLFRFRSDRAIQRRGVRDGLASIGLGKGGQHSNLRCNKACLVDWSIVAGQAGSIVTVAILCSIILLLDISGIEIITGRELSPDRELKVAGLTNLVNSVASGFPGVHVASDTAFTYRLGGDSRLMGLVYAGAVMLAIAAGTGFIGAIPTFILGGLLVYVGIDFLVDWAWHRRRDLFIADYLVILAILGVIASVGILEGVAFGFGVAVVLFVLTYSRLSVIKSEMNGSERASNVDRDPGSRRILNREGHRILINRLQGFIFLAHPTDFMRPSSSTFLTAMEGLTSSIWFSIFAMSASWIPRQYICFRNWRSWQIRRTCTSC